MTAVQRQIGESGALHISILNQRRRKSESAILSSMAHRPDPAEFDRPLTKEELLRREHQLAMLSLPHVVDAYRQAHEACRMDGDRIPRATAVQELVTTWKLLWRWRRRRAPGRG
jgi:hypothetical protein